MGRRPGAKNQDHDETRGALAAKVLGVVVRRGAQASLHDLAREAGVSIPTLKHYFGGRSGTVAEALRSVREGAREHLASVADPGKLGLEASLLQLASELAAAWVSEGVGKLFASGLSAGLSDGETGPGYLDGVLDPTVLAVEARLRVHGQRGELDAGLRDDLSLRVAALAFVSPLLVVLLHQHDLGGASCRPLSIDAFIGEHTRRFVLAYGAPGGARRRER